MKNNQKGIAHPVLIGLVVLVIGAIGFTAYRVGQNSNSQANNSDDASITDSVGEIDIEKTAENETVKIPDDEEEKEEEKPTTVTDTTKKTESNAPDKKDKTYLNIKSVSVVQDGDKLNVHSKVEKAVSGTCNFKLYREGYEKVHISKSISNSQDCKGTLDISDMPNYTGWSLHVWFDGSDGKTYAYQDAKSVSLTDPN